MYLKMGAQIKGRKHSKFYDLLRTKIKATLMGGNNVRKKYEGGFEL